MKLYHQQGTRSVRVRWMLAELGLRADIQQVNVYAGEGRKPEYLDVHPHGYVPALEDDGEVLIESAAICMYLADRYGDGKFAPAPGTLARGKYYEWMVYCPATADPCLETVMFHTIFLPEKHRLPVLVDRAKKNWTQKIEPRFIKALEKGPWILGDTFSAADVVVGSTLAWARMASVLGDSPALQRYVERLAARPTFAEAMG
jgi:glutathione S-transferase